MVEPAGAINGARRFHGNDLSLAISIPLQYEAPCGAWRIPEGYALPHLPRPGLCTDFSGNDSGEFALYGVVRYGEGGYRNDAAVINHRSLNNPR